MNDKVKKQIELINDIYPLSKKNIFLNEYQVAKIIGVSQSTLSKYRKEKKLEYKKVGGRYLYNKATLAEWLLLTVKTA